MSFDFKKKENNNFDIFKKEIKNNIIRNLYLFYGVEDYLTKYYVRHITDFVFEQKLKEMNFLIVEDEKVSFDTIIDFCDCMPIMSDKKLLIIKNTNLLSGKKSKSNEDSNKSKEMIEYLSSIPDYIYVIFIEGETVDKRNSIYNFIKTSGLVVEFQYQSKEELMSWVSKIFKKHEKTINQKEASYLIDNLDQEMQSIMNECMKLVNYLGEKKEVLIEDIDNVCTKSIDSKVFEMIDSIGQKNLQNAFRNLNDMISLKEPMMKVLVLIARHMRILLQVKLALKDGMQQSEISQRLGINYLNKYLNQCNNFSVEQLEKSMKLCANADNLIKTSNTDDRIVIETLIAQIAG